MANGSNRDLANKAGTSLEVGVFFYRGRGKTLIIPAGVNGSGWEAFKLALASTTAGPEFRNSDNQGRVLPESLYDGRSFAAVAASEFRDDRGPVWVRFWGLETKHWHFHTL